MASETAPQPPDWTARDRTAVRAILGISAIAIAFLFYIIYFMPGAEEKSGIFAYLPAFNAFFNGLSACCLVFALGAVKLKRYRAHAFAMLTALVFSTLFLVSYIVYHSVQGDTKFEGEGVSRIIYFAILIPHIILSIPMLPMIFIALWFAATRRFEKHRKFARITYPIWLYVSVTGVAIYFMLRHYSAG